MLMLMRAQQVKRRRLINKLAPARFIAASASAKMDQSGAASVALRPAAPENFACRPD